MTRLLTPILAALGLCLAPLLHVHAQTTLTSPGGADLSRVVPLISPEAQKVTELIEVRRFEEAQSLIREALAAKPRSPQWRFLEALLLAETGQDQEAIRAFEALTQEFPELAEPYNNLAVLYLRCGEPQRAREALEQAIFNRPDYGRAYENLGDLYSRLALEAYERGLRSGSRSQTPFMASKRNHLLNLPQPAPLSIQRQPGAAR